MKKIIASGAAAFLVFGAVAFSSPAFADDTVPVEETVAAQVVEETPVEEAPVVESAPVEVVQEAVVKTAPETIQQVAAFVPYAASARWLIPATWDYNTTPSYQSAIFPQLKLLTEGVPCGQWSQDDAYWIENAQEEALFLSLDDDGYLTMGEDSAIYATHVFTQGPVCETPVEEEPPAVPVTVCESDETFATSTNLNPQGWNLKPARAADGNAAWVDGGLKLDASDGVGSTWAQKQLNVPFSTLGSLETSLTDVSGVYAFGVILTLNDWDQQIHFDSDGRYWTNIQGIFPDDSLKGGYYETYDLAADLISDPNIQTIVLYVNSGQAATIVSQDYLCGTQTFDYEEEVVVEPPVEEPPVVVPPVVEPPVVVDPPFVPAIFAVTPAAASLAATGGPNMLPWGIGGAAAVLAGISGLLLRRRFVQQ